MVCAGELAGSSSSSSFLGGNEGQATSSSSSSMNLAVATFPLSFLMSNCSALQGLDQQVSHRGVGMRGGRGVVGQEEGGWGKWGTRGLHMMTPVLIRPSAMAARETCT